VNYDALGLRVTRKYAEAFLRVFGRHLTYADITKMEAAYRSLSSRKHILFFLQLPHLDNPTKSSMIEDLLAHLMMPAIFLQLFMLLVNDNRVFYIPHVLFFIIQLYKRSHAIESFAIMSTHDLNAQQKERIKYFLSSRTGSSIMCSYAIDKSLIAGIRMQSSEHMWEYSVRKQLACLRALEQ
jgi:ATP synthase F1 delta subunit